MWNWARIFKTLEPLAEGLIFRSKEISMKITKKTKFGIKLFLMKIWYTYV